MIKNSVCCAPYLRNHTSYDRHLWCKYVKWYHFYHFGQKMAQNEKIFCLSHSVPQEQYIIWLWFLVHMCKMMKTPANFSIFQNFDFFGFLGGKRTKNELKSPISVCFTLYLRNCRWYHWNFDNDMYRCFSLYFF